MSSLCYRLPHSWSVATPLLLQSWIYLWLDVFILLLLHWSVIWFQLREPFCELMTSISVIFWLQTSYWLGFGVPGASSCHPRVLQSTSNVSFCTLFSMTTSWFFFFQLKRRVAIEIVHSKENDSHFLLLIFHQSWAQNWMNQQKNWSDAEEIKCDTFLTTVYHILQSYMNLYFWNIKDPTTVI